MTNTTNTYKENNKALGLIDYGTHTYHKAKAKLYTYNYAVIDGILMEIYGDHTIKEIAETLNEYEPRIRYRIEFLQKKFPSSIVKKNSYTTRGAVVNKGTHKGKLSDVRQSKKVNS